MVDLILNTDTKGLRLFLGSLDVLWGIWLLLPMDTFSVSKSYSILDFWAPEWAWGIIVLVLGSLVLINMASNIYWSKLVMVSLFCNILFWGAIITAIFLVSPASTGIVVYFLVFLIAISLYVKGQVYRHHYPEGV